MCGQSRWIEAVKHREPTRAAFNPPRVHGQTNRLTSVSLFTGMRKRCLNSGFQARTDADPANSRQDEIDTEEKPENIEARNRPVRKDDEAENERDYAGQDHPDPWRPHLHAEG